MKKLITMDDVMAGKLIGTGHMNFGPDGSGYPFRHSTIRRLGGHDRIYKGRALKKSGVRDARIWTVDGQVVPDLEAAIVALNHPPIFTLEEISILSMIPEIWTEYRPLQDQARKANPDAFMILHSLSQKGAIESERRESEKKSYVRRIRTEPTDDSD